MKELGIAINGYGDAARSHGMAYRATPFHYDLPDGLVKIVGVADVNPNSTEAASKHLDCEVWTMNYRELLNQKDVEVDGIYEPSSTRQIP